MGLKKRNCDYCNRQYNADTRNLKRGWGLCCSKSCAAKKREENKKNKSNDQKSKKAINKKKVTRLSSIIAPSIYGASGEVQGITSEGYRVMDGVAYDEFDCPVYRIDDY